MVEAPRNSQDNAPVKANGEAVFEHLFPGNRYDYLPKFNLLNIPLLLKHEFYTIEMMDVDCFSAIRIGEGFAYRLEFPRPDMASMSMELRRIEPVEEIPQAGWFRDLFEEGEIIGGMGIHHFLGFANDEVCIRITGQSLKEIRERYFMKAVGIMGNAGKPQAIIVYKEGPRKRKEEQEQAVRIPGRLAYDPSKI